MVKRLNLQIKDNDNGNGNKNQETLKADFLTKEKLAIYLKKGLDIEDAAKLCGISPYMLSVFRSDPEFEEYIDQCKIECEESHLDNINDAGEAGMWNASAWVLERRFPEKYAKKDTVRHEYEIKLSSFMQLIFKTVNALEPMIRQSFLQKLRELDVNGEVIQMQQNEMLEYIPESKKGQTVR